MKLPLTVNVLVVEVNVPPESVNAPVSLIAAEPPTKLPVDTILPVVTAPEPWVNVPSAFTVSALVTVRGALPIFKEAPVCTVSEPTVCRLALAIVTECVADIVTLAVDGGTAPPCQVAGASQSPDLADVYGLASAVISACVSA